MRRPWGVIVAGAAGSIALLAILYLLPPLAFAPALDILTLLGSFFTEGIPALLVGSVLFLIVGILSAALYAGLWRVGVGRPSSRTGLLFGLLHGVGSVAALQILFALHPHPPPLYMTGAKSLIVLAGHLAFGLVVALLYRKLSSPAEARSPEDFERNYS